MSDVTLILLKPDALERQMVGQIMQRYEAKGLQIIAMKLVKLSKIQAARLYEEHRGRPFYTGLIKYL